MRAAFAAYASAHEPASIRQSPGGVCRHADIPLKPTWDRGLEMAHHGAITAALSMPVVFCDPHHPWQPWQRGTNENTNRLLPISAQER